MRYGRRARWMLSGFSWGHAYLGCQGLPEEAPYFQVRLGACASLRPSTPTPFNGLFRQPARVSLPRPRVAARGGMGLLTHSSIGLSVWMSLRSRLTPGRLTLPGKPRSFGGSASHAPYRYLYLHLLFRRLHRRSSLQLQRRRNAPLPASQDAPRLRQRVSYPIIIHARPLDQ